MENYKEYKKDFSRLGLAFVIGTIIITAAQTIVALVAAKVKPEWLDDPNMYLVLAVVPMYLIGMPILIALVNTLPGKAPEKHKMKPAHFGVAFIMCFAIMYVSNIIGSILVFIIGMIKRAAVGNTVVDIASGANMALTFVYMVVMAPILEEFVFRKLIVDRTAKYGQGVAIVMSGLMFGLFHGNLSQFAYATTLGMFFAFLYVKTGDLKITIGLHMLVNFLGAIVSVLILKLIKYDELLMYSQNMDSTAEAEMFMHFILENILGWLVYFGYILMILALLITGVVLLIVFRKRFALQPGEVVLPKGKRFSTMFLNVGMILYCVIWIGMIIVQLIR